MQKSILATSQKALQSFFKWWHFRWELFEMIFPLRLVGDTAVSRNKAIYEAFEVIPIHPFHAFFLCKTGSVLFSIGDHPPTHPSSIHGFSATYSGVGHRVRNPDPAQTFLSSATSPSSSRGTLMVPSTASASLQMPRQSICQSPAPVSPHLWTHLKQQFGGDLEWALHPWDR